VAWQTVNSKIIGAFSIVILSGAKNLFTFRHSIILPIIANST
jgi:hypothetical protein